jgi:hypothetical protein
MSQNAICNPGEIGSLRIRRMLTTAPATPHMRIKPKNHEPKVESTCLPLGGMIKATLPEISHVDSVGPEPGVGYGWSPACKGQLIMNNRSGMFARFARMR